MYHYWCCTGHRKIIAERFAGDGAIVYACDRQEGAWMYGVKTMCGQCKIPV